MLLRPAPAAPALSTAVLPHRRAGDRPGRDPRRHGPARADEPAAAGRCRLGQDGGGGAGGSRGGGGRGAIRLPGSHRDPRRRNRPGSSSSGSVRSASRVRSCWGVRRRRDGGESCPRWRRGRLPVLVGTHAILEYRGRVLPPRPGRGGRAAPIRRAPAPDAAGQGGAGGHDEERARRHGGGCGCRDGEGRTRRHHEGRTRRRDEERACRQGPGCRRRHDGESARTVSS